MNYQEAINYLQNLTKFGFNFGLQRISELLCRLGNPQTKIPVIHVGGTNGKGSTSVFISSILAAAGYRVGLFTSPHLHAYTERYRINGQEINHDRIAGLISKLKPLLEAMVAEGFEHPTEFEVSTALAFQYFWEEQVDFLVLEVGLGGAIDSTNVVNPEVSVITNVAMDHMDYLGNSLTEITQVKAGIIKPGRPVITASIDPEVLEVLTTVSDRQGSSLININTSAKWQITKFGQGGQTFDFEGWGGTLPHLQITLLGEHQVINAVTALGVISQLREQGWNISNDAVRSGLATAQWPGRLEIVQHQPTVVIDGAHNLAGAEALKEALTKYFTYNKLILVFGMLADKEREKVVAALAPLADSVIITRPNNPRAGQWWQFKEQVEQFVNAVYLEEEVSKAVERALDLAEPEDLICITGSLYMIAEAREWWNSLGRISL